MSNIIKASAGGGLIDGWDGDDTIYLGVGKDYVAWWSDDGNDTIYNFNPNYDVLLISEDLDSSYVTGNFRYGVSGNDIVIRNSKYNSTLTLKSGNTSSIKNYLSGLGIYAASMVWNSTKTNVAIYDNYSYSEFDADDYNYNIINIDASAMTKEFDIWGNANNNVIKASAGGGLLWGYKGNDTYYLGNGSDVVSWVSDFGSDTVYNFNPSYDSLVIWEDANHSYVTGNFRYGVSGNDIVIQNSKYNSTLTLKSGNTSSVKNYLSGLGISASGSYYSYKSSLGCIASSVSDTSVPGVMSYKECQPLASISDGTLVTASSELSTLQKKYAQY